MIDHDFDDQNKSTIENNMEILFIHNVFGKSRHA